MAAEGLDRPRQHIWSPLAPSAHGREVALEAGCVEGGVGCQAQGQPAAAHLLAPAVKHDSRPNAGTLLPSAFIHQKV